MSRSLFFGFDVFFLPAGAGFPYRTLSGSAPCVHFCFLSGSDSHVCRSLVSFKPWEGVCLCEFRAVVFGNGELVCESWQEPADQRKKLAKSGGL